MSKPYEMEGAIERIFDEQVFGASGFKRREFVITTVDGSYTQSVKFRFTKDRCAKLDAFKEGDNVVVRFVIDGRSWQDPKLPPDAPPKYFVDLTALDINPPAVVRTAPDTRAAASKSTPAAASSHLDEIPEDDLPF
ncbi:MAG: DUF3127 domain-containing protein [Kiritimatiellia bacterium]